MKNPYNLFLYILYGVLFLLSISFIGLIFRGSDIAKTFEAFNKFNYLIIFFWSLGGAISIAKMITDIWKDK